MKSETVSGMKGSRKSYGGLIPREGTHLRALYEQFKANPAQPIYVGINDRRSAIGQLVDFYGLDIRLFHEKRAPIRVGCSRMRYWLVGEWFGATYIDYVADRRRKEERMKPPQK